MSGGVRVIAIYAQLLSDMGHVVRIVSPPAAIVPVWRKLQAWWRGNGWPLNDSAQSSHLRGSNIPHHVLDRWRPVGDHDVPDADVVVATWWETAEWVADLGPAKGAKLYFIQHHEVFPHLPIERVRATYRLPLHKVVVAGWLKDVMSEQYGDHVVDVVPNSVDRHQFFAPPRHKQAIPTIGFLHSRSAFKGVDVTIQAVHQLQKRFVNLHVISFGCVIKSTPSELPGGVEYHYSPPQDQIRNLYARCDAWITSSRSEGFNLPALEAMACRTPVVSTRAGWPEEAVKTGWNGVLVDVDDLRGLVEGLDWVLSLNHHEWQTISAHAYATAASGSWQRSAELFEESLLNAARRSRILQAGGPSRGVGTKSTSAGLSPRAVC
jgi:glycosyltransferase involved in cell wall biosynthesis